MKLEFTVPFRRVPAPRTLLAERIPEPRVVRPESRGFWRWRTNWTRWFDRVRSPITANSPVWDTFPRRALLKSWFCCIWRPRFRNTFCFSPRAMIESLPS